MKIVTLAFAILLLSCQSKNKSNTYVAQVDTVDSTVEQTVGLTKIIPEQAPGVPDSSFTAFFNQFKSDTAFQLTRTLFPFQVLTWGPEDEDPTGSRISLNDWQHLDFSYPDSTTTQDSSTYSWHIRELGFETRFELRGINNPTHINYLFIPNDNGQWTLLRKEEYLAQ